MTKAEKRKFIRDLHRFMLKGALEQVAKMPDNWDGHEIREFLAGEWMQQRTTLMGRDSRRIRAFRKDCLTLGLGSW